LQGPLVINLWASWCEPCAKELPALQRLADRNTVTVIGVATDDTHDAAVSRAQDLGVRMPILFDGQGVLRKALGEANLPVTLFVDANGKVTRYVGPALTDEKLAGLVHDRLGAA
jgi:thiol-disulfide isomerase/thioredoxin